MFILRKLARRRRRRVVEQLARVNAYSAPREAGDMGVSDGLRAGSCTGCCWVEAGAHFAARTDCPVHGDLAVRPTGPQTAEGGLIGQEPY